MIRIDAAWLAVELLDMRAGIDTALTRVVAVFGAAAPRHAYCCRSSQQLYSCCLVVGGC